MSKNTKSKNLEHTFVICAYKTSLYLEKCVKSLKKQTVKSNIIMATSTPNDYIRNIANKYDIELSVRQGISDIGDDWNFAYNQAKTRWVTIAHQDDEYHTDYAKEMLNCIAEFEKPSMFFSDYVPINSDSKLKIDINCKIRRLLRSPMKNRVLAKKQFWRKAILALGNSICCPSVTYNKEFLGDSMFISKLKYNIDWDTFLMLAKKDAPFAYSDKVLTFYRVHDDATSKAFIENNRREQDDKYMFSMFWPKWVVRVIMIFYKKAYDTYGK